MISEVCDDPAVPAYMVHVCGITRMPSQEAVACYCYFCVKEAFFCIASSVCTLCFPVQCQFICPFFSLKPVVFKHYKYEDVLISSDFTVALVTSSSKL